MYLCITILHKYILYPSRIDLSCMLNKGLSLGFHILITFNGTRGGGLYI